MEVNIKLKQNDCKQHLPIAKQQTKEESENIWWLVGWICFSASFSDNYTEKNQKGIFIMIHYLCHQIASSL